MGVYIQNLEIPTSCFDCPIAHPALGNLGAAILGCPLIGKTLSAPFCEEKRMDNCPLVSVPEHGRLIDADALPKYDKPIGKLMMFGGEYVYTQTAIDNAPTIIPADGNLYDSLKRGLEQAINGESRSETISTDKEVKG